jgi:hypothetical protein
MSQQTAVEQLEKTIQSMIEHGADLGEDYPALMVHIAQAKEMERQQITDFANDYADAVMGGCLKRAEQYYTQTYGK